MSNETNYWATRHFSRRTILHGGGLGIAGLASAALIGCGSKDRPQKSSTTAPAAGVAAPAAPKIKYGGTLKVGTEGDPRAVDPHTGSGGGDHKYFYTISEGLVVYDKKGVPDPKISLAEKWEIVDGTTIIFTLRQGIKFHDGEPFNAEAVKANFARVRDPATKAAGGVAAGTIASVTSVEVVDERTLRVKLDAPNSAFLLNLGDRGGQMLSPKSFGDAAKLKTGLTVGTGPFIFKEWVRDSVVRVVKNPNYWRQDAAGNKLPYLDAIDILTIPNGNAREANLESGDVHITSPEPARLTAIEAAKKWQMVGTLTGWSGGFINTTLAPTDDVRFRRAIGFAIDRKAENASFYFGYNLVEDRMGPISPAYAWCYPGNVPDAPTFDLAEAKKLIAAIYGDKTPPKFTACNSPAIAARVPLWLDLLKKAGITMDWNPRTDSADQVFVKKVVNASMPTSFSLRPDVDGVMMETLHSTGFYNPGAQKVGPWAALDAAIVAARSTYDLNQRKEVYKNLSKMVTDLSPSVYTSYGKSYDIAAPQVRGFETMFGVEGKQHYADLWLA